MTVSPLAGKPATREMLVDVAALEREYYARRLDPDDPAERVSFGTSGHRGSALHGSFNEAHILAMTQARGTHLDRIVAEAQEIVNATLGAR